MFWEKHLSRISQLNRQKQEQKKKRKKTTKKATELDKKIITDTHPLSL